MGGLAKGLRLCGWIACAATYGAFRLGRRSGALTFVPLPGKLLYRTREGRLEVDQLRPPWHQASLDAPST